MKVSGLYLLLFLILSILVLNFYIDIPNQIPYPTTNAPPSSSPVQNLISFVSQAWGSVIRFPHNMNRLSNQISEEIERAPENAGIAAADLAYPVGKSFLKQSLVHFSNDVKALASSMWKHSFGEEGYILRQRNSEDVQVAAAGSEVQTHGSLRREPVAVAQSAMLLYSKSEAEESYIGEITNALDGAAEQVCSTLKTVQDSVAGAVTSFWDNCFGEKGYILRITPPKKRVLTFTEARDKRMRELAFNDAQSAVKDFASNISDSVASLLPTQDFFNIGNGLFNQGFVLPPQGFSGNVGIAG